jgi:hypothetical protein
VAFSLRFFYFQAFIMKKLFLIFWVVFAQLFFNQNSFADERHDVGKDWAEKNDIKDPGDCYSQHPGQGEDDDINNSPSFTEGCLEYLRDKGITDDSDEIKDEDVNDEEDE